MKTAFVLTGFGHVSEDKQYHWLIKHLKAQDYTVKLPKITWKRRVMSDYVQEFENFYRKNKGTNNLVLGFSYGAMIALITSTKLSPNKLILCSLSPYFHEDLKNLKPWWKVMIGLNRFTDFKKYDANKISKKINLTTSIIYGTKEAKKYPQLKKRCILSSQQIKNSTVRVAKGAGHQIDHPSYVESIKEAVQD